MRKLFFSCVFMICSLVCYSQFGAGIKINGGISQISNSANYPPFDINVEYVPTGHGGLFFYFPLGKKGYFGNELLFFQMEGEEKWHFDFVNFGNNVEYENDNISKHISYIAVPFYCGFKIKKVSADLGMQMAFGVKGSIHHKGEYYYNGNWTYWDEEMDEPSIKRFDYGIRVALKYNINTYLSIEANYYYGLFNILRDYDDLGWILKNSQATIGIRFDILNFVKSNRTSETETESNK